MKMKIALGSDHAGYQLKEQIKTFLEQEQYQCHDFGTDSLESVDYPDYAKMVSQSVAKKEYDFGILVCYTGIGMSMTSNKVKGIRAALVVNTENAKLTREHNNANVLCLGAKDVNIESAKEIVKTFLETPFSGGRHERRVEKIVRLENE